MIKATKDGWKTYNLWKVFGHVESKDTISKLSGRQTEREMKFWAESLRGTTEMLSNMSLMSTPTQNIKKFL